MCFEYLLIFRLQDVLVLLGPFIDEDHPLIKKCEVDVTFEELFQDIVEQVTEVIINRKCNR